MNLERPQLIESLRLHIRALQRAGLRFDAAGRAPFQAETPVSRPALLEQLRAAYSQCRGCRLCTARTQVVFGQGNADARLMLVGTAPNSDSDRQGIPFAGENGELLTRIIEAIQLTRTQVYITTAVKCIAPHDDPGEAAAAACRPILMREIEIIQPEVICALGPAAARILKDPASPAIPPRGTFYRVCGIPVMPTHHPELLLRRHALKKETWADVLQIQAKIDAC